MKKPAGSQTTSVEHRSAAKKETGAAAENRNEYALAEACRNNRFHDGAMSSDEDDDEQF